MRTTIVACVVSGVVGAAGMFAVMVGVPATATLSAQDALGYTAHGSAIAPRAETSGPVRLADPSGPAIGTGIVGYTPEEQVNIAVYESVNRSVVNIATEIGGQRFVVFDMPPDKGAGSGSVIDRSGHILTNFHVIEGARSIQATLFDGNTYDAKLVGGDPSTDIAVIKIDAPADALFPVQLGDSTKLKVGQRVFAIGNPFGLERTLTTGIISSLNRSLPARNSRTIKSIIQIDAAINPGNSGGPLLDSHAGLIGMNTAIASRTGQNTGVGFAIPASVISRVVPQLIARGRVVRPESGISRVLEADEGLIVATLVPGGPAEKAGLQGFRIIRQKKRQGPFVYEYETVDRKSADLILSVDGEKVKNADDFLSCVESKQPGQEILVEVQRGSQKLKIPLTLAQGE